MSKVVVITGGARSGKSNFAEQYILNEIGTATAIYLATAQCAEDDTEMRQRVRLHREQRPAHWITLEAEENLAASCAMILNEMPAKAILLDCLTLLISHTLLKHENAAHLSTMQQQEIEQVITTKLDALMQQSRDRDVVLVMVTNEVGSGIVPEYPLGRVFRDIAGRINQYAAKQADEVYALISGLPLRLK